MPASNFLSIVLFCVVLFGLVMINHNSAARIQYLTKLSTKKNLDRVCAFTYILPFICLVPIYYACIENIPQNLFINASTWNKLVFKPLNLALIISTETIAAVTDVALLFDVISLFKGKAIKHKAKRSMIQNLLYDYMVVWTLLSFDIIIKV